MLYQPARSIEISAGEIVCEADSFRYRFNSFAEEWRIEKRRKPHQLPPPGIDEYEDIRREARYRFVTEVADDEIRLEIYRKQEGRESSLGELEIYDRSAAVATWYPLEQDGFKSESAFVRQLLLSRPRVTDVSDDGRYLWVTLSYHRGGQYYGLGTLVRVDVLTGELELFQPPALATTSLSHVTTAAFGIWLGTVQYGESGTSPTLGLVRFDPVSGKVKSHLPDNSPILGHVITALAADGDTLWIGTDEGICRYRIYQREWTCWRYVPAVRTKGQVPVSNRPGGSAERRLQRGNYEVRWVSGDSLEVITRDFMEGWIELGPREKIPQRDHYADVRSLVTADGQPLDRWLLLDEPGGPPERAAVVQRIALEKQQLRTAEGWQKVKARAGWIPGEGLVIVPDLVLIEED